MKKTTTEQQNRRLLVALYESNSYYMQKKKKKNKRNKYLKGTNQLVRTAWHRSFDIHRRMLAACHYMHRTGVIDMLLPLNLFRVGDGTD